MNQSRTPAPSNVLLLIIPNPKSTILPHSLFYRLFSVHGVVEKILIFEKSRLWKAFVEMETKEQAQRAQLALNGYLVEGGVMNVYYSTFKSVTLFNNNSGGVDYRQLRESLHHNEGPQQFLQHYSPSSDKEESEIIKSPSSVKTLDKQPTIKIGRKPLKLRKENEERKTRTLVLLMEEQRENQEVKSSFGVQNAQCHQNDDDGFLDLIKQQPQQEEENSEHDATDDETQQDMDIMNAFSQHNQYNFLFSIPELQNEEQSFQKFDLDQIFVDQYMGQNLASQFLNPYNGFQPQYQPHLDPANYVNPQFLIENSPSKVIYVRGLHSPELTPEHLFNLFSNCGNIVTVIFIRHKYSALLQFEKLEHAQNAKDHLNNQNFLGAKLRIFYSNYKEIQLPLPYFSPLTQVLVPSKEMFRFGEGRNIVFNPPSQVLHVSNIHKEATKNELLFRGLFNQIGNILSIKFMNVQKSKHMALVKLSSIEEALRAAAELHGLELMGRKINISFTKSKL